ncbi:MAG: TetR/AcrR family transcriptional regulator [Candidatus Nanopelagicales bacterium]|nr:TetR/AcrR family transcriptional regulator [Candidatus Nanopelagicales bacterium]
MSERPETTAEKRRGRPRDPRVDASVTKNLLTLMAERGPGGFSVDELASRAGVGKAAIYRRYPSRAAMEEAGLAAVNEDMPDVSDLPVREALITLLGWLSGVHSGGMTPSWLMGMQKTPAIKEIYGKKVVAPRQRALEAVLQRGREEGFFREDLDLHAAMRALSWMAIMSGMHANIRSEHTDMEQMVDMLLTGMINPTRASDL